MRKSRVAGAMISAALLLPTAGCGLFDSGPSAEDIGTQFLKAFAAGDTAAAAAQTTNPQAAQALLDSTKNKLSAESANLVPTDTSEDDTGATTLKFNATWNFGQAKTWNYQGSMRLREDNEGRWRIDWAPSVIHPQLAPNQSLVRSDVKPDPAPVLDRDGAQLMGAENLVAVTLEKKSAGNVSQVAQQLAAPLSEIEPAITQQSILDGVNKAPEGQAYQVVTLRQSDYQRVKDRIYELPGVRFDEQTRLLAPKSDFASQVLPGIRKHIEAQEKANAGWRVSIVDSSGARVRNLHEQPPKPTQPTTVALSQKTQQAAENAVDAESKAAMIVAIKPSTGEIMAVAQNSAADAQGPMALVGRYPPGSTFKTVTALSALQQGKVNPNDQVACPATTVINGRTIPNDKNFDLGTVPFHTSYAKSCNTVFAPLAVKLAPDALTNTARELGIGVDFEIPGATTITGSVPPAQDDLERASDGFGQGKVLASPFGMALANASIARGSMPTPTLIKGTQTKANYQPRPLDPKALEALRPMMREVVTSGTATSIAGLPDVYGKTGTAQFGDGTRSHGWFAGYQGDLAFATLITDAGESGVAVDATKRFLEGAGG